MSHDIEMDCRAGCQEEIDGLKSELAISIAHAKDSDAARITLAHSLGKAQSEIERFKGELLVTGERKVSDGPIDAEDSKAWALRQPYGGHAHVLVSQLAHLETKGEVLARDLDHYAYLTRIVGQQNNHLTEEIVSLRKRFRYQIAIREWFERMIA